MEPKPLFQIPKSNTYKYDDSHVHQIPTTPEPARASGHQKTVTASGPQETATASDHREASARIPATTINLQPSQDPPTTSISTTVSTILHVQDYLLLLG